MPGNVSSLEPGHRGRGRVAAAGRDERVGFPVHHEEGHVDAVQPLRAIG